MNRSISVIPSKDGMNSAKNRIITICQGEEILRLTPRNDNCDTASNSGMTF